MEGVRWERKRPPSLPFLPYPLRQAAFASSSWKKVATVKSTRPKSTDPRSPLKLLSCLFALLKRLRSFPRENKDQEKRVVNLSVGSSLSLSSLFTFERRLNKNGLCGFLFLFFSWCLSKFLEPTSISETFGFLYKGCSFPRTNEKKNHPQFSTGSYGIASNSTTRPGFLADQWKLIAEASLAFTLASFFLGSTAGAGSS